MISELLTECHRITDEIKTITAQAELEPGYPHFQFYTTLDRLIEAIFDGTDHLQKIHTWMQSDGKLCVSAGFGDQRGGNDRVLVLVAHI